PVKITGQCGDISGWIIFMNPIEVVGNVSPRIRGSIAELRGTRIVLHPASDTNLNEAACCFDEQWTTAISRRCARLQIGDHLVRCQRVCKHTDKEFLLVV